MTSELTQATNRLEKNSKEWVLRAAGDEVDMEMIPDSFAMKIKDSVREGESFKLEWERVEVSPPDPMPNEGQVTNETHRCVASASRPGQSRRSPTRDLAVPG